MKNLLLIVVSALAMFANAQDRPQRGPYNTLPGGVIDGVAIQDEVPVRSKVEYEYVRASDVTWQRRVFSRIDSREKMNHDIFFPYDRFDWSAEGGSAYKPKTAAEIDLPTWNKSQSRWSLWTIIQRHIMLGDLTVYRVSSDLYETEEDGYSLKYPIAKQASDDYFSVMSYRSAINSVISTGGKGKPVTYKPDPEAEAEEPLVKTEQTLDEFLISIKDDAEKQDIFNYEKAQLQIWWDRAKAGEALKKDDLRLYLASNSIVAYHIKEDWYFDKERSVLDKRIIAIAPVARYTVSNEAEEGAVAGERGELLFYNESGIPFALQEGEFKEYNDAVEEREMFWLYFDELRNVLVNYYVYNDKNDAQWMSFDDLFWKRKFSSTIYKVSDKFDREIEDYKFGVEALYESERVKESIRNWEHDLWNY
jgi:hypothetical protein